MPVPKESEFLEAIHLLAAPIPNELLARYSWGLFDAPDRTLALRLLSETIDWDWSQRMQANSTPAIEWLNSDRMAVFAHAKMTKKWHKLNRDEWADLHYKRLMRRRYIYPEKERNDFELRWQLVQEIFDQSMLSLRAWPLGLLWALKEYHYEPHKIPNFLDSSKKVPKLQKQAAQGIAAIEDLISIVQQHAYETIHTSRTSPRRLLERLLEEWERIQIPVRRADQTAPERLLIFRLWQILRHISPRQAPRVIQNILLMDGIKNQIDERGVERMCASFKQKKGFNADYRWLIGHVRGKNYRDEMTKRRYSDCPPENHEASAPEAPLKGSA